jgi:hypothetical protein
VQYGSRGPSPLWFGLLSLHFQVTPTHTILENHCIHCALSHGRRRLRCGVRHRCSGAVLSGNTTTQALTYRHWWAAEPE